MLPNDSISGTTRLAPFALRLAVAAAFLGVAGCASTPEGEAQELAGCYYFEQDATAQALSLPWGVRLTTDTLTGWPPLDQQPNTHTAVTLVGVDETADFPFGYWQALPGDSVRIGYPGAGGFVLDLTARDGVLEGTARPVGDAGLGAREMRGVRLGLARCPGE